MSTYTPKTAQADGGRRRSWRAQILRDKAGEPIRGQWDGIVDDKTWWRAQDILDNTERVTNTSGSTKRKHLGSGLYRGSVCGGKVTGAPHGYRCAGHVMRTGSHIDEFVTEVIAARLGHPDTQRRNKKTGEGPEAPGISAAISEQRGRILRAQRDYDDEVIEGRDLKRIREAAEARIAELEVEQLLQGRSGALAPILGMGDPAAAFREAPLEVQRQVIDTLATVTLHPQPRGRRGFDPISVTVDWR